MNPPRTNDAYTWRAVYNDERTCICENEENSFASVDQTQVKAMLLLPLTGLPPHRVDIPPGATPIFFRRRTLAVNLSTDEGTPEPTKHCIGWRRGDEAVYLFVFDDGSTLLTDNLQAI